jgi:hypothetical protein
MVGGSRTGFRLPIRSQAPGPAESVVVCGQGGNVEPNHSDGFGTMRCGVMASSPARDAAGNAILNLYPLAFLGQILAPGDSGGPVFFDEALVGINSESGSEMSVAVSVPEAAAWIDGVTASSWAASARVQWIDVRLAEIQGTNQPWTDVAATPWAQANRSAQEVCTRRGYTGGFYTGEALGDRRGVVCLGNEIAQFFDVPQTEIDQLPEPFVDVDTVPWAQAQRMADKLCIARGLPHGFFTGHHVDYYLNGQLLLPWVRGLVCQSHSFHWRDVDPQTLSSSSAQPISSVDALDWGTAARAATRYCWNRGYASEYFSGWQSPQGLGTVCIATAPPRVDEITAQPTTPGGRAQLEFNGLFEGGADLALVLYQCVFPVTDARIEWSTRNQLRVSLSAPYGNFCYFGVYRGDGESTYLKPFWVPAGTPLPSGPPAFCVVTGTC